MQDRQAMARLLQSKPYHDHLGIKNYKDDFGGFAPEGLPLEWQSAPDQPATRLAYITKKEEEKLRELNLHDKPNPEDIGTKNRGPGNIPSFDDSGGGVGDGDSDGGDDNDSQDGAGIGNQGEDPGVDGLGSDGATGPGDDPGGADPVQAAFEESLILNTKEFPTEVHQPNVGFFNGFMPFNLAAPPPPTTVSRRDSTPDLGFTLGKAASYATSPMATALSDITSSLPSANVATAGLQSINDQEAEVSETPTENEIDDQPGDYATPLGGPVATPLQVAAQIEEQQALANQLLGRPGYTRAGQGTIYL